MSFLIDTNILLRSADPTHSMHADAVTATNILLDRGEDVCIIPQNLIEFWNVYTRPADKNGLGHSPGETAAEVNRLKGLFLLLPDRLAIYSEWERLVLSYGVRGVNVHDARLVAAMLVHGLTHILTFNIKDFARYAEVTAVHPMEMRSP
ncbi:type II toxin-antitoxin system VapC family toxin [Oscillatoria acuminata]|uniref:Putative nucleic acid-binding protein, contains PIN domain n=1 Tax=Oscillatoria acuminata PCC 6304 TaxID=56110 RepID=K9TC09_9CYAN|nr:type II toxin-antitoxin system VapC family toxin [Oscillatoria acuminata]AFY80075.1 putative nucleic acid-binding protein, contains PIN domain [Oscillatoria acuminata PCC 6304]